MTLDDLERIAREATQGGNGRPGRLTDSEIDRQHAGDHSFTAIESMACELRQRRAADKAIIALLAELRSARAVVEAAEEWRAAEIAEQEWAIGTDEYEQQSAVRARDVLPERCRVKLPAFVVHPIALSCSHYDAPPPREPHHSLPDGAQEVG